MNKGSIFQKDAGRIAVICLAGLLMAVNINTFVQAGGLYPGGVTGMTVLIQRITAMYTGYTPPYTVINVALNAIPVYIGFRYIGKKFTIYSLIMIMVTNVLTDFIPYYTITYDTLLIAIFGGLVNGLCVSLCLVENATSGGTDFLAIYFSEKHGIDTFNYVLGLNAVILCIAGVIFGWDKALYSIIFQFCSTQVIHTIYRRYRQMTMLIITSKPYEVSERIHEICHHGATILDGEGAYEHTERKIVYSVISSPDKQRVIKAINEIDDKAFVNILNTEQVGGWFYYEPQD